MLWFWLKYFPTPLVSCCYWRHYIKYFQSVWYETCRGFNQHQQGFKATGGLIFTADCTIKICDNLLKHTNQSFSLIGCLKCSETGSMRSVCIVYHSLIGVLLVYMWNSINQWRPTSFRSHTSSGERRAPTPARLLLAAVELDNFPRQRNVCQGRLITSCVLHDFNKGELQSIVS